MFFTLSTADEMVVFAEGRDLLRHLIGRKTGVLPHHCHYGDVYLGKDVRRRLFNRRDAEQQHKQRHHDERVWTPES